VDESEFYDPDENDDVTMAAGYDNDDDHHVSAIQVRGRVKHLGGDHTDDESLRLSTGNTRVINNNNVCLLVYRILLICLRPGISDQRAIHNAMLWVSN